MQTSHDADVDMLAKRERKKEKEKTDTYNGRTGKKRKEKRTY